MDEKGCMMGVVGKVRVIVPKGEKNQVLAHCGNREWVSLIECISIDGRCLPLWVIFKGKQHQKSWYQVLESGGHIALSDNGWTDNELGLEWMKQCFEPATSTNDFRLLLLDGHASHISTTTLQFRLEHKIVLLCLPPHSTHLLQPLDVGIFPPLATAYKKGIQERSRYSVVYSIDKVDFLEVYQAARKTAITPENVQKAWQATGIYPFNPQVVLSQLLPSRPQTPSTSTHVLFKTAEGSIEVPMTPQNQEILISPMKYCMQGDNHIDPLVYLEKVGKAALHAMADTVVQQETIKGLMHAVNHKNRSKRSNEHYGHARVINQVVINERKEEAASKAFKSAAKALLRLGPDLFMSPKRLSPVKRKLKDTTFEAAVKPLLKLSPEIFSQPLKTQKEQAGQQAGQQVKAKAGQRAGQRVGQQTGQQIKAKAVSQKIKKSLVVTAKPTVTRSGRVAIKKRFWEP